MKSNKAVVKMMQAKSAERSIAPLVEEMLGALGEDPTRDGLELYRRVAILLARERLVQPVRLIGVSAAALTAEQTGQLGLLEGNAVRRERLARAVDRITGRFGLDAIRPATLVRRRPRED